MNIEDLKCCGNCAHYDEQNTRGDYCDKNPGDTRINSGMVCNNWRHDKLEYQDRLIEFYNREELFYNREDV